jgi:hypothetical protein
MADTILNVLTWAMILMGVCAFVFMVWFIVWTIGENK